MTKTTYYKKVVPSKISLLPPIKNPEAKTYESQILYDKVLDLVVQSPNVEFKKDPLCFLFSEEKYPEFCLFLSELRESVINTLVAKSESFFKGKVFTYDEISARFPGLYKNCGDEFAENISKSIFIVESRDQEESFEQKKVQCILKFEKIIFKKSEIILYSRILKSKETTGKKKFCVSEDCVFEDTDDFFCENDELC